MKGTEQHETFYKHKYERNVKKLKEFEESDDFRRNIIWSKKHKINQA